MESNVKRLVRTRCGFQGLCWIRGWGSPGSGASEIMVYGISGPFDGDIDEESQLFLVTLDPQNWKNLMAVVDSGQDPTAATEVYAAGLESPKAPIAQTFKIAL